LNKIFSPFRAVINVLFTNHRMFRWLLTFRPFGLFKPKKPLFLPHASNHPMPEMFLGAFRDRCPKCKKQWKDTQCLECKQWSPHIDWYKNLDDWLKKELELIKKWKEEEQVV